MDSALTRLLEIMARLRSPDGCPWDREQTLDTLKTYLIEETYEVRDAMESGSPQALREELGDLLFQIVFQCQIAGEMGWFNLDDVAREIGDKLTRRHPHVFADKQIATSGEVVKQWEELKDQERAKKGTSSRLANVPRSLPSLLRALRLSEKAARAGFDWAALEPVFEKVREEISEWQSAAEEGDADQTAREFGDLMFSLVNAARHLGIEPEAALQEANDKFASRFRHLEDTLRKEGKQPEEETVARLEELWVEAKKIERDR